MIKLIALVLLAAGTVPGFDADILEGATFEVPADQADQLVADGKAKLAENSAPPAKERNVKARLLVDGEHGRCNDVVELPANVVKALVARGDADTDKGAVAYAMTLEQNQPKAKA